MTLHSNFFHWTCPFCVLESTFHLVSECSETLRDTWWQHKLHLLSRCLGTYCLGTVSCQVRQSVNCNHMRLCSHLCNGTHSTFSFQQDSRNKQIWCGLSAAAQKTSSTEDPQVMLDYVTCYRRVTHSGLSELLTHTIVTNGQVMVVLSHWIWGQVVVSQGMTGILLNSFQSLKVNCAIHVKSHFMRF